MAVPVILAIGAGMKVYSDYMGNQAQARAEIENAQLYDMQAAFAREAMSREALLSRRKYSGTIGAQKGAFAKAGVSISQGSSVGVIANTLAQQVDELDAIKKKGDLDFRIASLRASQARSVAETLQSPLYNITQASGTALTAYAASGGGK